jgi:CheY-like chemotaxis protein
LNVPKHNRLVLLVDDDDVIPTAIVHFGRQLHIPLDFKRAADVAEAIELLNHECFDCAVIDVRLPGVTGASLGALVREHDDDIPLAYLTNLDTEAVRKEAIVQRAFVLQKLQFLGSDEGMVELLGIIEAMAELNPCVKDGVRVDNHGFPRHFSQTPIRLPDSLMVLLNHSKALTAAY